jgi:energy-coupling factor transport system substrate-specific component
MATSGSVHESVHPASTRWRSALVLAVASLVGLGSFLYPFVLPVGNQLVDEDQARAGFAPLLFAVVVAVCLAATLVTLAGDAGVSRSRSVALLGVLVAIDATLRLVPSILGASAIFLLIILVGAVFGATMGFQMGVLTLLFSALITGGIGPWLPFQMLVAGWVGLTAGWLPQRGPMRVRIAVIAIFGAAWGFLFGALMNLWFWPFAAPGLDADAGLYWSPNLGPWETVVRYARFYAVTSLGFDLARAVGNIVLVLVFGAPILRLLERYRSRFTWQPWSDLGLEAPGIERGPASPGVTAPPA